MVALGSPPGSLSSSDQRVGSVYRKRLEFPPNEWALSLAQQGLVTQGKSSTHAPPAMSCQASIVVYIDYRLLSSLGNLHHTLGYYECWLSGRRLPSQHKISLVVGCYISIVWRCLLQSLKLPLNLTLLGPLQSSAWRMSEDVMSLPRPTSAFFFDSGKIK